VKSEWIENEERQASPRLFFGARACALSGSGWLAFSPCSLTFLLLSSSYDFERIAAELVDYLWRTYKKALHTDNNNLKRNE